MSTHIRAIVRFILAAALIAAIFAARPAKAGGTVGDGTPGSCTEAALDAALAGGGLVTFDCGGTNLDIILTSQKTITADTTIDGGGDITLDGNNATRLFSVMAGASLTLENLILSNGSNLNGGAIYNAGTLTIFNSTLVHNNAPGGIGGALVNDGTATIRECILLENAASAGLGGAISNSGDLTVLSCYFTSNFAGFAGGAIVSNGTVTIEGSDFTYNQSPGGGGAISSNGELTIGTTYFYSNTASSGYGGALYNSSTLLATDNTFSSNAARSGGGCLYNSGSGTIVHNIFSVNFLTGSGQGGGIYNAGDLAVNTSLFYYNQAPGGMGGGIHNTGSLALDGATLLGNTTSAGLGGGVNNEASGTAMVTNCSFFANFGGLGGGGIIANGPITVTNSTFQENEIGGLVNNGSNTMLVRNTVVASNRPYNCSGTIASAGHNLDSANTCAFCTAGDLINTDPLLGPMAYYPAAIWVLPLLPGSPAVNAGDNDGCPATDQRGMPRPQLGVCDIGAFELVMNIYLPVTKK